MASPADATPRGKRIPTCKTCERSGKLPSALRTQHCLVAAARGEEGALSRVAGKSVHHVGGLFD